MTKNVAYPIGDVEPGHCVWCGEKTPESRSNRKRKFCSRRCMSRAGYFRETGKAVYGDSSPLESCVECGGKIPPQPRGGGSVKMYCSPECREEAKRERLGNSRAKARYAEHRDRVIAENAVKYAGARCEHCGGEPQWTDLGVPRRFCSVKCQRRERYARHLAENPPCSVEGCDRPQHCGGLCSSHWAKKWNAEHPDAYWRSRAEYRARKRAATVEPVSRDAVLERDHWRCGICGGPIPKDAVWPDVRSASIDHVVPLNAGGDHSMANCQAAHYGCNASKKDAGGGEQLALIG